MSNVAPPPLKFVVITGAGGFIGSHLTEKLIYRGIKVLATDLSADIPARLEHLSGSSLFDYAMQDVTETTFSDWLVTTGCDAVAHLASVVGVKNYVSDPLNTISVIIDGTRNVLRAAQTAGFKVLITSTSEVYGRNPAVPWREDGDRVLGPTTIDRWTYSAAKGVTEHMALGAAKSHDTGFPVTIIRYFNIYGPGQTPIFVVPAMIQKAVSGEPLPVFDSGDQTRCFTFVDDAVEGTIAALLDQEHSGEVFNIGNPVETTIKSLAELILEEASEFHSPGIEFIDAAAKYGSYEDIMRRVPDVSKARALLGWEPQIDLATGIKLTIKAAVMNGESL